MEARGTPRDELTARRPQHGYPIPIVPPPQCGPLPSAAMRVLNSLSMAVVHRVPAGRPAGRAPVRATAVRRRLRPPRPRRGGTCALLRGRRRCRMPCGPGSTGSTSGRRQPAGRACTWYSTDAANASRSRRSKLPGPRGRTYLRLPAGTTGRASTAILPVTVAGIGDGRVSRCRPGYVLRQEGLPLLLSADGAGALAAGRPAHRRPRRTPGRGGFLPRVVTQWGPAAPAR